MTRRFFGFPARQEHPRQSHLVGPDGWVLIGLIWAGVIAAIVGFKIVDWFIGPSAVWWW
jgi:hypothetical protein